MSEDFKPGFSIVLCTHNGRNRLEPTLKHLSRLQIPTAQSVELIVVDNASTDDTASFVKQTWDDLGASFPLISLTESRPGKGYATELGYDTAAYSYILTVDDDNWLSDDYLIKAIEIFKQHPDVGVLQGHSEGAFETQPPAWINGMEHYFVIGGPWRETGYFPKDYFFVWGAGMVILKADWVYLRSKGFSALTSKLPGKAAGEDNELGVGLLLLGRKIYYSEKLRYKHFMPAGRVQWEKLKQNFEVFGYVNHYFFVYGLAFDSLQKKYQLTDAIVKKKFWQHWRRQAKKFTWKQHLAYWLKPQQDVYQLRLFQYYSQYKWFTKLSKQIPKDVSFLLSWIEPVIKEKESKFHWMLE